MTDPEDVDLFAVSNIIVWIIFIVYGTIDDDVVCKTAYDVCKENKVVRESWRSRKRSIPDCTIHHRAFEP